jgi:hypothetical protein
MKTFNQFINESIRDKMTPKSEDEILKSLKNLTPIEQLLTGIKYNIHWVVKDLINKGIFDDMDIFDKEEILSDVVMDNNVEVLSMLIDAGIDIHSENDWALTHACLNNYYNMVKLLLEKGANPHANNNIIKNLEEFIDGIWYTEKEKKGYSDILKLLKEYINK